MVERDDALGLEIMKQMGLGGDEARTALPIACDEGWGDMTDGDGRARSLSAWLAPVLYSSARHPTGRALHTLRRCVDCLAMADPSHPKNQALQVEIALAQGFRHAANQRSDARRVELADSGKYQQKRTALFEQAHRALEGSVFWYSHVVLIQAMALLSLPAKPSRDKPGQGPASNPHSEVTAWLYSSSNRGHPFVQEAAALAVDALETQCPENYLWTDESTVTRQVGSSSEPGSLPADHWWWILPSAGWATLDPRAQRLVADIMLMLNLTARGDRTIQEERLRRANIATLPPCLAHSRDQLDVGRTVGSVRGASIVTACLPGCDFKLCPYPPKGALSYRSELSEGICRKLASDPGRAWWQKDVPHKDLREFWAKMAGRTLPRHGD